MYTDIKECRRKVFNGEVNEDILPRRLVLRVALAVGCSMLLPAALFGCDAKKSAGSSSADPGSSPVNSSEPSAEEMGGKVSQTSVHYKAQPKGDQKCGNCANFIAESNTCKLVDGQIVPDGWCNLWAEKA